MFGNVNVDYKPCKTKIQLDRASRYMLGELLEQELRGEVKTAPNLCWDMNCDRDIYSCDILTTRKLFGKRDSKNANLAFKMSISFSPDDNDKLTYEEAFNIAKEFAEKFFTGYQVMFAVHTDTPHKHVHFLVGNCHIETGKAYRRNQKDLQTMCEFFGEQCMKRGLIHSVRDEYYKSDSDRDKETFSERQMKAKGKETFKDELREVIRIECADLNNRTLEDVVNALMKHYHVECRVKGNTISYRHPNFTDKNGELVSGRGSNLGDKYTVKGINYELGKIQRGREDRDLTARTIIIDSAGGRRNIGENRSANGKTEAARAVSRTESNHETANRTAVFPGAEAEENRQRFYHKGNDEKRSGEDTQKLQSIPFITKAGGNDGENSGGIRKGTGAETSDSSGHRQYQNEGELFAGPVWGEHGRVKEGREGSADGISSASDVRSFDDLFREYEQRNGTSERKCKPQSEPTRDVRKNRRKRNTPDGR